MVDKCRSVPYCPGDYLTTHEDVVEYLNLALKDGDERVLLMVLRNVADALDGLPPISTGAGLARENLYWALADGGGLKCSSLMAVLRALGLELSVRRRAAS